MHCPAKPIRKTTERFGNLMELYEQNYMLLRLLVPRLKLGRVSTAVSRVPDCLDLYLQLTEQSPYTSTLRMTYRFVDQVGSRASAEPDLYVRVYHDARSAEVSSGLLHGQRHTPRTTRQLDNSWVLNRFLYKWLRYLLHRGHRYDLTDQAALVGAAVADANTQEPVAALLQEPVGSADPALADSGRRQQ